MKVTRWFRVDGLPYYYKGANLTAFYDRSNVMYCGTLPLQVTVIQVWMTLDLGSVYGHMYAFDN